MKRSELNKLIKEIIEQEKVYSGELNTSTDDFIWNEVSSWLKQFLSELNVKFKTFNYKGNGYVFDFQNENKIFLRCEKAQSFNGASNIKFSIKDPISKNEHIIFQYKIVPVHFTNRGSIKNVFQNGSFKNYYLIDGVKLDGSYKSEYQIVKPDSKYIAYKTKLWKTLVDSGEYLKKDFNFKKIMIDDTEVSFNELLLLPKTIINAIKKDFYFKNFIRNVSQKTLNSKLMKQSLTSDLSVEAVALFLKLTVKQHQTTVEDKSGPWATTGTSEFIDKYDISKLQQKYTNCNDFILSNKDQILKELQKDVYKHPLGYYKFKNFYINNNFLIISASSTTYYN